jgi:hypothetical protein
MPIRATDYSKTIIYKLVCNDPDVIDLYVGHTTDFNTRKSRHKQACCNEKNKEYNEKKYQIMRGSGGWDNWNMVLVEKYPCADGLEARQREHYWYEILKAGMNTRQPYRTEEQRLAYYKTYNEEHKGYFEEYYKINKEKMKATQKEYRVANAEKIREYNQQHYEANAERINAQRKIYREVNKDKIREQNKAYNAKKKEKNNVVV